MVQVHLAPRRFSETVSVRVFVADSFGLVESRTPVAIATGAIVPLVPSANAIAMDRIDRRRVDMIQLPRS